MFLKTESWATLQKLKSENRIERLYVRYNQERKNKNSTVFVFCEVNGQQYEGQSQTHKKDQFVKSIGREIAAGRLLKALKLHSLI